MKGKQRILTGVMTALLMLTGAGRLTAQASVSQEVTGMYSLGIAGEEQMLTSELPGTFAERKNGYLVKGSFDVKASIEYTLDLFLRVSANTRTGSPYLALQLPETSASELSLGLDTAYARLHVLNGLGVISPPLEIYIQAGKFSQGADNLTVSRYGLEGASGMVKTSSSPAIALQIEKVFLGIDQFYLGTSSSLLFEAGTAGLLDEAVPRLYDTDGGLSNHGKPVLGEYAPQFFASLSLNRYVLPVGLLSGDISYAYNGAGIYSGHSLGGSVRFDAFLKKNVWFLPLAVHAGFSEKNIDVLARTTGTGALNATTDLRQALRLGVALGVQYASPIPAFTDLNPPPRIDAELTVAGAYSHIGHIYRDDLSMWGLSVDGRFMLARKFFLGAGLILPVLGEAVWSTREDVSTALDSYSHGFTTLQNLGWEAYAGFQVSGSARFTLGISQNRGLSMNYGLEGLQEGLVKYRQPGTEESEGLLQTFGVYALTSVRL